MKASTSHHRLPVLAIESKSSHEDSQLPKSKSFCCSSSQKVSNAAVSIPPIDHVSYVHGAYAAVAPLFVKDSFWEAGVATSDAQSS
jgi:hypothetical protein